MKIGKIKTRLSFKKWQGHGPKAALPPAALGQGCKSNQIFEIFDLKLFDLIYQRKYLFTGLPWPVLRATIYLCSHMRITVILGKSIGHVKPNNTQK